MQVLMLSGMLLTLAWPRPAQAQSRDTATADSLAARSPGNPVLRDSTPSCCAIVRLDRGKSMVTARELATGFTFRFEVKGRQQRTALKVGQPVWADFTKRTVKLNATDASPCCAIIPPEAP